MESIFYKSLALTSLVALAASCSNDMEYVDITPSPVTAFYEPIEGKNVKLVPSNSASLLFEWEAAHAVDGSVPQYEVAFFDDNSSLDKPLYKVTADNNGAKPMATISHKTLSKVMAAAGVGGGEEGVIKWGVLSYSGVNAAKSTTVQSLKITRFEGFAEIPAELYLTGAGSETGEDLSAARAFSKPDAETFEMFTKLNAGEKIYFSADRDGIETFSLKENKVVEGENGGTTVDATGVYRVTLDFSTAGATVRKIDHLYFRFTDFSGFTAVSADNHVAFEYDYVGNGVYRKAATVKTKDTGWSWDPFESRYNLLMVYSDNSEVTWAPTNTGLDGKPSNLDINSDYFNMQEFNGKVGYKWKLADAWYNVPVVYSAYFNEDYGKFKHFMVAE